jgi:hypothetical protein
MFAFIGETSFVWGVLFRGGMVSEQSIYRAAAKQHKIGSSASCRNLQQFMQLLNFSVPTATAI